MLLLTLDVFNLILFCMAVLPLATFDTQQMFIIDFESFNAYRNVNNEYSGGK